MTVKAITGPQKHIAVASVLLLCFTALFLLYYKPTMSWLSCYDIAVPKCDCTEQCGGVPKAENLTNTITDCTVNNAVAATQSTPTPTPPTPPTTPSPYEEERLILIWKWPFGETFDLDSCESGYGIKACRLTLDRNLMDKAHSVMFHVRDIGGEVQYLETLSRPSGQKWVWMNMESPTNTPQLPGADDLFNLTSNYRRDSDVWVPYGRLVEASEEERKEFKIPEKDKLVCWIVTHWEGQFRRTAYFNEFSKYINVEGYGHHFGRHVNFEDYSKVMSSCKFYLSFENSIHRDYISEKVFNPMKLGTVPVVLGPPRENYEEYLPKDSFIHVDDFETPEKLAEHLKFMDQNQTMYEQYFAWRKQYIAKSSAFGQEHACRICDHIRKIRNFRVFKNVNKWYWS